MSKMLQLPVRNGDFVRLKYALTGAKKAHLQGVLVYTVDTLKFL